MGKRGLIVALMLVSLAALFRVGSAFYNYELFMLDHNAPSIPVGTPTIPRPYFMQPPPMHITPPVGHPDNRICDERCWQRAVVTI